MYVGVLAMYEHEVDKSPKVIHNDVRSDNYVTFTFNPNPIFDVTGTTFYQPLFKKAADFRILNQLTLNIKATKHFAITTNWDYSYDSAPAEGTPNVNFTITNGFSYRF